MRDNISSVTCKFQLTFHITPITNVYTACNGRQDVMHVLDMVPSVHQIRLQTVV